MSDGPAIPSVRLVRYEEKVIALDLSRVADAVFNAPRGQEQAACEQALERAEADGKVIYHFKAEIDPPPPPAEPAPVLAGLTPQQRAQVEALVADTLRRMQADSAAGKLGLGDIAARLAEVRVRTMALGLPDPGAAIKHLLAEAAAEAAALGREQWKRKGPPAAD